MKFPRKTKIYFTIKKIFILVLRLMPRDRTQLDLIELPFLISFQERHL